MCRFLRPGEISHFKARCRIIAKSHREQPLLQDRSIRVKYERIEMCSVSSLSVGTYLCTLKLSEKVIETQRFIVVR